MEQSFSQRKGLKPVKAIQVNSMDEDLRKALWNDFTLHIWYPHNTWGVFRKLLDEIWIYFFKNLIDMKPKDFSPTHLKEYYFKLSWDEVYDFIEFTANWFPYSDEFIKACNATLERELSAYRFVSKTLVQITSEQEITEIEKALSVSKQFTHHLDRALELLANRISPDYANSIKESISAVEATCRLITGDPKVTVGTALGRLESKLGLLHTNLKEAFQKLYWYTSDAEGIRHGLVGKPDLDVEDARFMFIACSAFINYLVAKADKAGIALSQK